MSKKKSNNKIKEFLNNIKKLNFRDKRIVILSLVSILVLISLITTTFAMFFSTKTSGDKDLYKTGDLVVKFDDTTGNAVNINPAKPVSDSYASTFEPYTFSIENTGTYAASYSIILTDEIITNPNGLTNNEVKSYIKYQINDEEPKLLSSLDGNVIASGCLNSETLSFDLRLWIDSSAPIAMENTTYSAKVGVSGKAIRQCENTENTLAYKAINNSKYAIYGGANTNIGYNYYTEIGLYKTTYSSKDTYTYKGNVNDNYVTFAGKTWRILKINADGTIDMTTGGVKIPYTSSTTPATCSTISPDSTELNNWYDETFTETEKGKISSVKTYSNTNETFTDANDYTAVSYMDIIDYKLSGSCYDDGTGYIEIGTHTPSTYYISTTGQGVLEYTYSYTDLYTMPVITLISDLMVSDGTGVSGDPYVIQ